MTVCLSHESYGTVIMTLYETIGGTEVVKQRIIVGCDLDSFETSTPYMNNVDKRDEFECADSQTRVFAFNRFETSGETDTLSMTNMDGNVAFSKQNYYLAD